MSIWPLFKNLMVGFFCLVFLSFIFVPIPLFAISDTQVLFENALKASREGEFVEALSLWDELIKIDSDNSAAWSNRGNVRLALGDSRGAIEDQTKSIELTPMEIDPYLNRGLAEESLKLWDAARKDYTLILDQNPEDPSALYNLANVYGAQGNWSNAAFLYQKASLARPGFVMARSSEALSTYQNGEFDQAESQLRSVIRRYPMTADARAALSALLWRQGRFGEAESHWTAAIGLDNRYMHKDWLLNVRRWPPQPSEDLIAFLALERP